MNDGSTRDATNAEYSGPFMVCCDCGNEFPPRINKNGHIDLGFYKKRTRCRPCVRIKLGLDLKARQQQPDIKASHLARALDPERRHQSAMRIYRRLDDPIEYAQWRAAINSPTVKALQSLRMKRRMNTPEAKKRSSETMTRLNLDPAHQAKAIAAQVHTPENIKKWHAGRDAMQSRLKTDPELKQWYGDNIRRGIERSQADPVKKETNKRNRSAAQKTSWANATPERKQKRSESGKRIMKERFQDPSFREKNAEHLRKLVKDPAHRQKVIEGQQRAWADPEWRAKRIEHHVGAAKTRGSERYDYLMNTYTRFCCGCKERLLPKISPYNGGVEPENQFVERRFCSYACSRTPGVTRKEPFKEQFKKMTQELAVKKGMVKHRNGRKVLAPSEKPKGRRGKDTYTWYNLLLQETGIEPYAPPTERAGRKQLKRELLRS